MLLVTIIYIYRRVFFNIAVSLAKAQNSCTHLDCRVCLNYSMKVVVYY